MKITASLFTFVDNTIQQTKTSYKIMKKKFIFGS